MIIIIWLVVLTPLKNMKVNWDDDIPYMKWKIIQSCLKRPSPVIDIPSIIHL